MAIGGFLFFAVLFWYPAYKRLVFPKLLKAEWFRDWFNITEEGRQRYEIGLDNSGVASGFWFFYITGFVVLTLACLIPFTIFLFK
jgi:hypothetical protein